MKRLILQVNVRPQKEETNGFICTQVGERTFKYHDDLYNLSQQQAKEYAVKTQSDYLQINDCDYMPEFHPIWQRFKMFELTQYDHILYLDMDVVVLPNAPDIFELYKDHKFSAVPNQEFHRPLKSIQEYLRKDQKRYSSSNTYYPFCSGVMLMRSDWLAETKLIYKKYIPKFARAWHDQGVLNSCIIEQGEKYNHLSYHWGQHDKRGDYFIHLSGWKKNKFDLQKFKKRYKIT
jgi:alpha-N-acetylglucosamine transferase